MPQKIISIEELLEAAQKTENAIGCFNSLLADLHRLAGELDAMYEYEDECKLLPMLKSGHDLFSTLTKLMESHSQELRHFIELLTEPEPPWNINRFR